MDSSKLMSAEEVKEFFSQTSEFQVKDTGVNLEISFKDSLHPGKVCSTLIWKEHMNIQQLIRVITQLVWNMNNNNFD